MASRRAETKKAAPTKGAKPAKAPAAKPAKPPKPAKAPAAKAGTSDKPSGRISPGAPGGPGPGDRAPTFSLPDHSGAVVTSASLAGKPYVLYFYPKDDTPGCTREACGFRDEGKTLGSLGARVLGVSPDSPASHTRFREKYGLGFPLLSDAERTLAKAYGVWVKKKNYGREYMGIERSTFLVDARGKIAKVFRNVRVDGHVAAVLEALRALG